MDVLAPDSVDGVLAAVTESLMHELPLEIRGGGTKRDFGRPSRTNRILDLKRLAGIRLYEPDELVLTAAAGTPLAEIERRLAEQKQILAFEPPDWGPIYGLPAGGQTLGGVISCNLSGPRRIKAGAARDHFLGFQAVTGRGEVVKAGGRVMKNVTGYDLPKLMCGAMGTLGVLAEITMKVLPAPEKTRTVLLFGRNESEAVEAMAAALNSPHDVSAAAHLPAAIAARSAVSYLRDANRAVTAVRVEGPGPSVEYRCAALRELLNRCGPTEELHSMNAAKLWRELRDVAALLPDRARDLWRVSAPPASGAEVVQAVLKRLDAEFFFDWGGGLIWLATPPSEQSASAVRGALASCGGHATLVRASGEMRTRVAVFHPEPPSATALAQRIKEAFDPKGILNPGRMN